MEKTQREIARILNDFNFDECIRLLSILRDMRAGESYTQELAQDMLTNPVRLVAILGDLDGRAQELTQMAVNAFGVCPWWNDKAQQRYQR